MVWVPGPAAPGSKVLPVIPGPVKVPEGVPVRVIGSSEVHAVSGNPEMDCALERPNVPNRNVKISTQFFQFGFVGKVFLILNSCIDFL